MAAPVPASAPASCATCRHFGSSVDAAKRRAMVEKLGYGPPTECRRYPTYVRRNDADLCGEWKERA